MIKIRKTLNTKPRENYPYFLENLEEWRKFRNGEVIEVSKLVFESMSSDVELVEEVEDVVEIKFPREGKKQRRRK